MSIARFVAALYLATAVVLTAHSAPLTSPLELLTNGGFETDTAGWSPGGGVALTLASTTGFTAVPPGSTSYLEGPVNGAGYGMLWQTVNLPAAADYSGTPNSHRRVKLSFHGGGEVYVAVFLNASGGAVEGWTTLDCREVSDTDGTFRREIGVLDPIPPAAVTATVVILMAGAVTRGIVDEVSLRAEPSSYYSKIRTLEDGASPYGEGDHVEYTGVYSTEVFEAFGLFGGVDGTPTNYVVNGDGRQGVDPGWAITGVVEMSMMDDSRSDRMFLYGAAELLGNTIFRCAGPGNCEMTQTFALPAYGAAVAVNLLVHFHSPSMYASARLTFKNAVPASTYIEATATSTSYQLRHVGTDFGSGWTSVDVSLKMAPGDRAGALYGLIRPFDSTSKQEGNILIGGKGASYRTDLWAGVSSCGTFTVIDQLFEVPSSSYDVYSDNPGGPGCTYVHTVDISADIAAAEAAWDAYETTFLGTTVRRYDLRLEATLGGLSSTSKAASATAKLLNPATSVIKTLSAGTMNSAARGGSDSLLVFKDHDLYLDLEDTRDLKVEILFTGNGLFVEDIKVRLIPMFGSLIANWQGESQVANEFWTIENDRSGLAVFKTLTLHDDLGENTFGAAGGGQTNWMALFKQTIPSEGTDPGAPSHTPTPDASKRYDVSFVPDVYGPNSVGNAWMSIKAVLTHADTSTTTLDFGWLMPNGYLTTRGLAVMNVPGDVVSTLVEIKWQKNTNFNHALEADNLRLAFTETVSDNIIVGSHTSASQAAWVRDPSTPSLHTLGHYLWNLGRPILGVLPNGGSTTAPSLWTQAAEVPVSVLRDATGRRPQFLDVNMSAHMGGSGSGSIKYEAVLKKNDGTVVKTLTLELAPHHRGGFTTLRYLQHTERVPTYVTLFSKVDFRLTLVETGDAWFEHVSFRVKGGDYATPSVSPSMSATASPLPSRSVSLTATPPLLIPATATPTSTANPTPSVSVQPSATPSLRPTGTRTVTPTAWVSVSTTLTSTKVVSRTVSLAHTPSASLVQTASNSATNTRPSTPSDSPTLTRPGSATPTATAAPSTSGSTPMTASASPHPTNTATVLQTVSHTATQTASPTASAVVSGTSTLVQTPSASPAPTVTVSGTVSPSGSPSGSPSSTQPPTASPTVTTVPSSSASTPMTVSTSQHPTNTATVLQTMSHTVTQTASPTASAVVSGTSTLVQTPSASPAPTVTVSGAVSPSTSSSGSLSATQPPTASPTATAAPSTSGSTPMTASASPHPTNTATVLQTVSHTAAQTASTTASAVVSGTSSLVQTPSASSAPTVTVSDTASPSTSPSGSLSSTQPPTASPTMTAVPSTSGSTPMTVSTSPHPTNTATVLQTSSMTATLGIPPTATSTSTAAPGVSASIPITVSRSAAATKTESALHTASMTATGSAAVSGTVSTALTQSQTAATTPSVSAAASRTASLPVTATTSDTVTGAVTATSSVVGSSTASLTLSSPGTPSPALSATVSPQSTASVSPKPTRSGSSSLPPPPTGSPSLSVTPPRSATLSLTPTRSASRSAPLVRADSPSATPTASAVFNQTMPPIVLEFFGLPAEVAVPSPLAVFYVAAKRGVGGDVVAGGGHAQRPVTLTLAPADGSLFTFRARNATGYFGDDGKARLHFPLEPLAAPSVVVTVTAVCARCPGAMNLPVTRNVTLVHCTASRAVQSQAPHVVPAVPTTISQPSIVSTVPAALRSPHMQGGLVCVASDPQANASTATAVIPGSETAAAVVDVCRVQCPGWAGTYTTLSTLGVNAGSSGALRLPGIALRSPLGTISPNETVTHVALLGARVLFWPLTIRLDTTTTTVATDRACPIPGTAISSQLSGAASHAADVSSLCARRNGSAPDSVGYGVVEVTRGVSVVDANGTLLLPTTTTGAAAVSFAAVISGVSRTLSAVHLPGTPVVSGPKANVSITATNTTRGTSFRVVAVYNSSSEAGAVLTLNLSLPIADLQTAGHLSMEAAIPPTALIAHDVGWSTANVTEQLGRCVLRPALAATVSQSSGNRVPCTTPSDQCSQLTVASARTVAASVVAADFAIAGGVSYRAVAVVSQLSSAIVVDATDTVTCSLQGAAAMTLGCQPHPRAIISDTTPLTVTSAFAPRHTGQLLRIGAGSVESVSATFTLPTVARRTLVRSVAGCTDAYPSTGDCPPGAQVTVAGVGLHRLAAALAPQPVAIFDATNGTLSESTSTAPALHFAPPSGSSWSLDTASRVTDTALFDSAALPATNTTAAERSVAVSWLAPIIASCGALTIAVNGTEIVCSGLHGATGHQAALAVRTTDAAQIAARAPPTQCALAPSEQSVSASTAAVTDPTTLLWQSPGAVQCAVPVVVPNAASAVATANSTVLLPSLNGTAKHVARVAEQSNRTITSRADSNATVQLNGTVLYPGVTLSMRARSNRPGDNAKTVNRCAWYASSTLRMNRTVGGAPMATDPATPTPADGLFGESERWAQCGGHGLCIDTDAGWQLHTARGAPAEAHGCVCFADLTRGFWVTPTDATATADADNVVSVATAVPCSVCGPWYEGSEYRNCTARCPASTQDPSLPCSGRGRCHDGRCYCDTPFGGVACGAQCPYDPLTGLLCAGHGACNTANGTCDCAAGFDGPECAVCGPGLCGAACTTPIAMCSGCFNATNATAQCGANEICDPSSSQCRCRPGRFGPSCTDACPIVGTDTLPCSGHGVCGALSSMCDCTSGYVGSTCYIECPGHGTALGACSGHGTCVIAPLFDTATCACNVGYGGVNCSVCAAGYGGSACDTACPRSLGGDVCFGHGVCNTAGSCDCFSDSASGYWAGSSCDGCAVGAFGGQCAGQCLGNGCAACGGHGRCDDGVNGTGACICSRNDTAGGPGMWGGLDCLTCVTHWFGPQCNRRCPADQFRAVCGGHGSCTDGTTGTGHCVCAGTAFALANDAATGNMLCVECARGYAGPSCAPCGGVTALVGEPCSGHGACSQGRNGTGTCQCAHGYSGVNCDVPCLVGGLVCSGRGQCGASGCVCAGNYTAASRCAECADGFFGAACQPCPSCADGACDDGTAGSGQCVCNAGAGGALCDIPCPRSADGTVCSGHGSCDVATGTCACTTGGVSAWAGSACDRCAASHAGSEAVGCTIGCPSALGGLCADAGQCGNGTCSCDAGRCGEACEFSGAACDSNRTACPDRCNDRGFCAAATGTCHCDAGFAGARCEVTCAALNLCSGHGMCTATATVGSTVGRCICTFGYWGATCGNACPGGSAPCSGHGACSAMDGSCVCVAGYAGSECGRACPRWSNATSAVGAVCGGHGACDANTAECRCNAGFAGLSCEACAEGYFGALCGDLCDRTGGVTVGSDCVCRDGYGGIGCAVMCPLGSADPSAFVPTLCSGHGVCSAVNGTCVCSASYYTASCAVRCDVASCSTAPPGSDVGRWQCVPESGACACAGSPSEGFWGGLECLDCARGYWGPGCQARCACKHGTCGRYDGACNCDYDDVLGFWRGIVCDHCAEGYIGQWCRTRNAPVLDAAFGSMATSPDLDLSPSVVDLPTGGAGYRLRGSVTADDVARGVEVTLLDTTVILTAVVDTHGAASDCGGEGNNGGRQRTIRATKDLRPMAIAALPSHGGVAPPQVDPSATDDFRLTSVVRRSSHWFIVGALAVTEDTDSSSASSASATSSGVRKGVAVVLFSFPVSTAVDETEAETALSKTFASCVAVIPISYGSGDAYRAALLSTAATLALAHDGTAVVFFFDGDNVAGRRLDGSLIGVIRDVAASPGAVSLRTALGCPAGCGIIVASVTVSPFAAPTAASGDLALAIAGASGNGWFVLTAAVTAADMSIRAFASPPSVGGWATAPFAHTATMGAVLPMLREVEFNGDNCTEALTCSAGPLSSASAGQRVEFTCILLCADLAAQTTAAVAVTAPVFTAAPPTPVAAPKATVLRVSAAGADVAVTGFTLVAPTGGRSASATATRAFVVLTETESVGGRDVTVASSCIVTLDVDAAKVIGFVQRDQGGVALQLVLGLFAPSPAPAPATVPSCAASRRSFATAAAGDPTTTGELVLTAQLGSRLQIRPAASFAVTGLTPRVVDGSLLAAGRLSVAVVGVALDAAEVTATSGARRCFFRRLSTGRVVSTVAVVSPAATDDLPPATHRAVCVVPSLDAPSSCDTVEVSFGTSTVSVTGPAVTLNVAPEAVLLSAANEDRPSFGPMVVEATLSNVTVAGRGFVASGRARCGVFESAALNARLLIVADADVLGSADVRCRFDSSVRMITPGAVLRYSHDAAPTPSPSSSLAFGPSAVPFAIVSRPAGLHVSITAAGTGGEGAGPLGSAMRPTVRADASIVGAAATQDMRSNVLGPAALFPARTQAERSAAASSMGRCRCSVFRDGRQQRLQLLGSTTGGEDSSVNETSGDIDPATGAAFVTPFTIVDAVATEHLGYRHEMRCALKHWAGMLEFFVTPGAVVALRSLVPAGQMHASPDPSAVEPVDLRLVAVDASGNAVTDLSRIPAVVTAAWTSHVSNTMAPAALQDYDMVSLTSTGSPSEAGVYTFAPLVAVQGLHGWGYDLTVTTEAAMGPESAATARAFGGKAVNATQAGSVVTTLYMVTLYTAPCVAPSEYAVPLTQRCAPCPALAICDGTTRIAAKPGAWRSRDDSYAVYSCDAADGGSGACLGEAVCETGHSGPLCRVCEDDYGAAGSNKCGRCPSRYLSAGLVALIAVVLSAVVFFFAVRSVADGAAVVAQRKHQLQRIMGVLRKRLRSTESPNRHLRGRRGSRADRVQIQAVEAGPTSALGVTDRHFLENLSNSESEGDEALSPPGLREMFVEDDRADAQPATATNTRPSVVAQPPQRKSPLVLTLKLLVSHLQLVGAASILFLPYAPPFVATFFDVESSSGGGQVTFSFAFVSCLLAPTVQEKLVLVSAAAGVAAGGATVLMLVHRFIKAARSGTDQAEAEHHASKVPLAVGGDMSEGRQSSGLFSPTEASILGMSGIVKPPDFLRPGSGGPLARCQLAQAHHDLLAMSANRTGDAPEAVRDRMRRHRSFAALKSPGAAFDLTGIPESVRSPPMIVPFAPLELTASTRLGAPTCDAMVASLLSQRRHPMPAALRGGGRGRHPPMPRYAPGGRQRSSSGGASDLFERTVLSARTSVASDAHPRMTPRDSGVVPPRKGSFGSAPSTVAPAARAAVRAVLSVVVPGLQAFVVAAAVALFIVFPSAVNTAAGALRCSEYDYGQGRTVRVLAADHSVPCDDAGVKATAVLTLIGFALGLPAGLALLITGASRLVFAPHVGPWCCPGSQDPAAVSLHLAQRRCSRALGHTKALGLFYYFTGGYRPSRWWWECVLLLRKAAVFTVVAAVPNERQRVYAVMWALAVSMVVANAGRPFASPILSQLELVSMLSLVVTVNAAMVAPHAVSTNSDGTMDTGAPLALLLSVVVFVVNVAVLAVFAAAVGMFGIAYVPANIRHMVGLWVGRRKVEGLQEELAAVRQQLTTHRSAALETTAALHVNASGESLNDPGVSATSLDAARSSSGGAEWTLAKVARRITIAEAASAFRASATTQPRSVPCDLSDSESEVRSPLRNRSTTTTTMTTTTMTTTTAALHRLPRSRSGSDEMEGGALSDILASKGALQFSTTGDGSKHAMSDDSAGRSGGSQPPPMPEIMTLDHRGQFDLDGVSFCTSAEAPTHAAGGVAIPVPELADGATSDASGARRPAGARFDSLINSASGSQRRGGSPPLPGMSQGSPGGPSLHAGSSVTFSLARTSTASRPPLALRGPPTTQAFSDPMAQPRCRGVSPDSATAVAGQSHSSFARSASSSRFAPLVEQVGSQADSEGAVSRAAPRGQRSVTFQQRPSVVLSRSTVVTEADAEAVLPVVVLPDPELRAAAVQSVMAQGSMANADSIEAATQNLVVARATFTALATGVDAHADPNRVVDAFSGMLEAERSVAELTLRALETADAQASDTTSLE